MSGLVPPHRTVIYADNDVVRGSCEFCGWSEHRTWRAFPGWRRSAVFTWMAQVHAADILLSEANAHAAYAAAGRVARRRSESGGRA